VARLLSGRNKVKQATVAVLFCVPLAIALATSPPGWNAAGIASGEPLVESEMDDPSLGRFGELIRQDVTAFDADFSSPRMSQPKPPRVDDRPAGGLIESDQGVS